MNAQEIANLVVVDHDLLAFRAQFAETEDLDLLREILAKLPILDDNAPTLPSTDLIIQSEAMEMVVGCMCLLVGEKVPTVTKETLRNVVDTCWQYFDPQDARNIFDEKITDWSVSSDNEKLINCVVGLVRIGSEWGPELLDALLPQLA